MANIFELNVNINTLGQTEAEKALSKTVNGDDSNDSEVDSLKPAVKAASGSLIIKEAYNKIAEPVMDLALSRYGAIYGDVARQNSINNMMNTVDMGMGVATSALTGFSVGKAIGGKGAGGTMAIIMAIIDIANTVIDGIGNIREYNNRQLDYRYNSDYAKERLGILSASKGR